MHGTAPFAVRRFDDDVQRADDYQSSYIHSWG
jgi:hypothetical protein